MIPIKKIYFSVLIVFSAVIAIGQNPLTLQDAILIGLKNNFDISISKEEYNIAKLNNKQGTAGRWPSIDIGVNSLNRYDNTPSLDTSSMDFVRGDQYTNSLTPYVELRWLLFDGLSVNMNKKKLDLLEQFSSGYSTIVIENTIQAILLGYYFALLEIERLKVLLEVKELSGDRYFYEMMRKDLGTAVTFEVLQAKNSFYSDSTNYLLQELNVKNAFLRLNLLLGQPPSTQYMLVDSFQVDIQYYDLQDMMDKMMLNNTNLKNQYINQEILRKDISITKSFRIIS